MGNHNDLEALTGQNLTPKESQLLAQLLGAPDSIELKHPLAAAPDQTHELPQDVMVDSIIVLKRSASAGHYIYTSLGPRLQDSIFGTNTKDFPLLLFSKIREKFKPADFPGEDEPDKQYELNIMGKQKYAIVLNFGRENPVLKDYFGRNHSWYAHAIVLNQRPDSIEGIRAQVKKAYLESSGKPTIKEAVETIHAQMQNLVRKRGGDTNAASTFLENLMAM